MDYPVTEDGRYFVVRGRLWRCSNPKLTRQHKAILVKKLMLARRTRDRIGVDKAKRALGERGPTWWKGPDYNRYLAKNTPYAAWFEALGHRGFPPSLPTSGDAREGAASKPTKLKRTKNAGKIQVRSTNKQGSVVGRKKPHAANPAPR